MITIENFTRVNNDVNGNPRYVIHFLNCLSDKENDLFNNNNTEGFYNPISSKYELALKKMKQLGGRKFHNKQFGGGIVFQSYNLRELSEQINELNK
jgi:hypothetical protein